MSKTLTKRFRAAVRDAAVSIQDLANEAGYSGVMFDAYVNRRSVSRSAALALAEALEARAARLLVHAERLREAAGDEAGGAGR